MDCVFCYVICCAKDRCPWGIGMGLDCCFFAVADGDAWKSRV